jgi:hypothetical protein
MGFEHLEPSIFGSFIEVNAKSNNRLGALVTTRSRATEGLLKIGLLTAMDNRRDEMLCQHQKGKWKMKAEGQSRKLDCRGSH